MMSEDRVQQRATATPQTGKREPALKAADFHQIIEERLYHADLHHPNTLI